MDKAKRAQTAETPKQPSLGLKLRAPYLYPDRKQARRRDPGDRVGLDRAPRHAQFGAVADVVEIWMTLSPAFSGYRVMRQRQAFADPS